MSDAHAKVANGTVIAAFGQTFVVEMPGSEKLRCVTRGRRSAVTCGDDVRVLRLGSGQGVIESVAPRRTLLQRADATRRKLIAANVDQVVLLLAARPSYYEELLVRTLVAAEHAGITAILALNKMDLGAESNAALQALEPYRTLGYLLIPLSAREDVSPLAAALQGRTSVLVGQSGMGKSTLVNALAPDADAEVAAISAALDSGRHTTTSSRMYRIDADTRLIDSPGLQNYGLHHLALEDIAWGFREFRNRIGTCRFANCAHLAEPGCAIDAAGRAGEISARRLALYRAIARERIATTAREGGVSRPSGRRGRGT